MSSCDSDTGLILSSDDFYFTGSLSEDITFYDENTQVSSNPTGIKVNGTVTADAFYQTSDIRKKNIIREVPIDKCYDMLDKCQEIIYTLKDQTKEQIGLIAQEVEEFFPEVINTDAEGYKSLDYAKLVVVCLKLIKDLSSRISKLEKNG